MFVITENITKRPVLSLKQVNFGYFYVALLAVRIELHTAYNNSSIDIGITVSIEYTNNCIFDITIDIIIA